MSTYVPGDGLGPADSSGSMLVLFVRELRKYGIECDVKPCGPFHAAI